MCLERHSQHDVGHALPNLRHRHRQCRLYRCSKHGEKEPNRCPHRRWTDLHGDTSPTMSLRPSVTRLLATLVCVAIAEMVLLANPVVTSTSPTLTASPQTQVLTVTGGQFTPDAT